MISYQSMTNPTCFPDQAPDSLYQVQDWEQLPQRSEHKVAPSLDWSFVNVCNIVEQSGVPNVEGCKIPLSSKLNLSEWEKRLVSYHDKEVVEFLRYGFPISYRGELHLEANSGVSNHNGATNFPQHIDTFIESELSKGRILGPFDESPFWEETKISPLNSVEKRGSQEIRTILDLSFPKVQSANDGIQKQSYLQNDIDLKYPSVDEFAFEVYRKGRGAAMYKVDLKAACRQIPICPGDVRKMGYVWKGKLYLDRVLSMGLRTGAYICQRVTNAILFIHRQTGHTSVVFLDDFVGVERPEQAFEAYCDLRDLLKVLGVDESEPKLCPPNIVMLFLGVWFNSYKLTMEIDKKRLEEILLLLDKWFHKKKATRKEIESLIGLLSFVAKCVRSSRVFLSRMLDCLRAFPEVGSHEVGEEFLRDVYWWRTFMPSYNGVSMIPRPHWSQVDKVLATDACLTGCGGMNFITGEFFHAEFPPEFTSGDWDINALELLTIMVAIKLWGAGLSGERMRMLCDNAVAVSAMNYARIRNRNMQACMRETAYWMAKFECEVFVIHLEGEKNRIPDALSRWHSGEKFREEFKRQTKYMSIKEVELNDSLFQFTAPWC